ncbi:MAG: DUF1508 domain-containing protein [Ignavibacteriae bacterium]|nr:MAG: DUF1508 domain-containing protein [Ignavibacteriota bacterium]
MVFYIYKDKAGEWRWFLKSSNGNKIADSAEGYFSKKHCLDAIGLVMDTNRATPYYEV